MAHVAMGLAQTLETVPPTFPALDLPAHGEGAFREALLLDAKCPDAYLGLALLDELRGNEQSARPRPPFALPSSCSTPTPFGLTKGRSDPGPSN